jgi:predicted ArsR family transcriptional regulator
MSPRYHAENIRRLRALIVESGPITVKDGGRELDMPLPAVREALDDLVAMGELRLWEMNDQRIQLYG